MPHQRCQGNEIVLVGFEELPPEAVTQQVRVDLDARDRRVLREQRSDALGRQRSPLSEEHKGKAQVATGPILLKKREESDFLLARNHSGEVLDFHALRHTCGAWAALGGAHPKAVQTLMRHSTITLTMDTYGHLFPGQDAETVHRLPDMTKRPDELPSSESSENSTKTVEEGTPLGVVPVPSRPQSEVLG